MANESSAVLSGIVGGFVFIGIAILVGDHFYEQCVDDFGDDNICLGDEWYLKDGECCTMKYSWQAWCCGLPFALIGIGIIGASLSGEEKKTMPEQNYTMYDADTGKVDTLSSVGGSHLANTGSELKNTCKRCDKVWYLATDELQDLESRLSTAQKAIGQMSGLTMISALTNPGMLTAQMGTSNMAALGPVQQLQKELEEKSRCPECQSKSIERELVDDYEPPKAEPKKAVKKKVVRKSVSKKVVRKAAPPQDAPKKPPVNMGEGIISITCPSCAKIHNIDEDTMKFICSCGRRIRVN